ncbi:ribokinase [Cohnella xylanilytica]|uniref:ribokinase n=1 Tax=Cohnella xylanilytica TaxID=557555 RepID=UPI001B0D020E|nr:ribokinase [Cohnella xylanilytica]GIO11207.1 ribokinase [Cohnella xylanilytica]
MKPGPVLVVGSLNMDIVTRAPKFPLRGETILGEEVRFVPGGKGANQAVAAARLGAAAVMLGAVGEDRFGEELTASLEGSGVRTGRLLVKPGTATGIASITLTPFDNNIVVVPGANGRLTRRDIEAAVDEFAAAAVVLLQLEIPLDAVVRASELAREHGVPVVLNPAPACELPPELLANATYITPNRTELAALTGEEELEPAVDKLLAMGPEYAIVTLGSEGAAWKRRGEPLRQAEAYRVPVVDTTGAGDAFNGGLASALVRGLSVEESLRFAMKTAALAVTRFGAQAGMPTLEEVERFPQPAPKAGATNAAREGEEI